MAPRAAGAGLIATSDRTVGVGRAVASRPSVATVQARVIAHELAVRLGPIRVEFRSDVPLGLPWLPSTQSPWPTDLLGPIDVDDLLGSHDPPLIAAFARRLEARATEVRIRMLRHLGLLPAAGFVLDDDRLTELERLPLRPTDLWLVCRAADGIAVDDPDLVALASPTAPDLRAIDAWFDAQVAALGHEGATS